MEKSKSFEQQIFELKNYKGGESIQASTIFDIQALTPPVNLNLKKKKGSMHESSKSRS